MRCRRWPLATGRDPDAGRSRAPDVDELWARSVQSSASLDSRDHLEEVVACAAVSSEQEEAVRLGGKHAVPGLEVNPCRNARSLARRLSVPVVDVDPLGVRTECRGLKLCDGGPCTRCSAIDDQRGPGAACAKDAVVSGSWLRAVSAVVLLTWSSMTAARFDERFSTMTSRSHLR